MANFCSNCGAALNDGAKFCPECGRSLNQNSEPQKETAATENTVKAGAPAPGFSTKINDPRILEAVEKTRSIAGKSTFFIVPLPLIGFIIYSFFSNDMETSQAFIYGGIISLVFLLFALYSFAKSRAKNTYEATVIDKKSRRAYRNNSSDDDDYYTQYITVVKTTDGKKKKIIEQEGSQIWAWNYLQVGDRFIYHPQFNFPYELYDKSKAPYIVCVSCLTKNAVEDDVCKKCGLPLIK